MADSAARPADHALNGQKTKSISAGNTQAATTTLSPDSVSRLISEKQRLTLVLKQLQLASERALDEFETIKNENTSLRNVAETIQSQNGQLKRELITVQYQLEQSEMIIEQLCVGARKAVAEFHEFKQEHEQLKESHDQALKKMKKLERDFSTTSVSLQQTRQRSLSESNEFLRDINELRKEKDRLARENEDLRHDVTVIMKELASMEDYHLILQALSEAQQEKERLETHVIELQESLDTLEPKQNAEIQNIKQELTKALEQVESIKLKMNTEQNRASRHLSQIFETLPVAIQRPPMVSATTSPIANDQSPSTPKTADPLPLSARDNQNRGFTLFGIPLRSPVTSEDSYVPKIVDQTPLTNRESIISNQSQATTHSEASEKTLVRPQSIPVMSHSNSQRSSDGTNHRVSMYMDRVTVSPLNISPPASDPETPASDLETPVEKANLIPRVKSEPPKHHPLRQSLYSDPRRSEAILDTERSLPPPLVEVPTRPSTAHIESDGLDTPRTEEFQFGEGEREAMHDETTPNTPIPVAVIDSALPTPIDPVSKDSVLVPKDGAKPKPMESPRQGIPSNRPLSMARMEDSIMALQMLLQSEQLNSFNPIKTRYSNLDTTLPSDTAKTTQQTKNTSPKKEVVYSDSNSDTQSKYSADESNVQGSNRKSVLFVGHAIDTGLPFQSALQTQKTTMEQQQAKRQITDDGSVLQPELNAPLAQSRRQDNTESWYSTKTVEHRSANHRLSNATMLEFTTPELPPRSLKTSEQLQASMSLIGNMLRELEHEFANDQ